MKQRAAKLKAWWDRNDTPIVTGSIFILIALVMMHIPWVSPIAAGAAWFAVQWLYNELCTWRRLAFNEHARHKRIEAALANSNMQVVAYCAICTQKVLDIDEHYKKIHPDSDYAKETK